MWVKQQDTTHLGMVYTSYKNGDWGMVKIIVLPTLYAYVPWSEKIGLYPFGGRTNTLINHEYQ